MSYRISLIYKPSNQITTGEYWHRALVKLGHQVTFFEPEQMAGMEGSFDLLIRVDDGFNKSDPIREMKKKAGFPLTIYYANDTWQPRTLKMNLAIARHYDVVLCSQYLKLGLRPLKKYCQRVLWVPFGYDADLTYKKDIAKIRSIGFIGGDHHELRLPRKYMVQELRERYPDAYIGKAPSDQMRDVYSSSKIGINLSIAWGLNMRFFDIMSCGTFLLSSRIIEDGIELLGFEDGRHYVSFSSYTEMFDKIEYYLRQDHQREEIAASGYQFLLENHHTYTDRVRSALEAIGR